MEGEFESFYNRCPQIAESETRHIINFNEVAFPKGEYALLENYCNDKECDCRKVIINVVSKNKIFATIGHGWEDLKFYEQWAGDKELAIDVKGPILELGGIQSEYAKDFLKLFKDSLLRDYVFIERLKKHYKMFRKKL